MEPRAFVLYEERKKKYRKFSVFGDTRYLRALFRRIQDGSTERKSEKKMARAHKSNACTDVY